MVDYYSRNTGSLCFQERIILNSKRGYLKGLTQQIIQCVDANGREVLPEARFLDWSTAENKEAIHAGLHALLYWALTCAEKFVARIK